MQNKTKSSLTLHYSVAISIYQTNEVEKNERGFHLYNAYQGKTWSRGWMC